MERIRIPFIGFNRVILQLDNNYAPVPFDGYHSYGVCGKDVIVYLFNDMVFDVYALKVTSGYVDRIIMRGYGEYITLVFNVFVPSAGANPKLAKGEFHFEWGQIL